MSVFVKLVYRGKSKNKFKDIVQRIKFGKNIEDKDSKLDAQKLMNALEEDVYKVGELKQFIVTKKYPELNKIGLTAKNIKFFYNNKEVNLGNDKPIIDADKPFGAALSDVVDFCKNETQNKFINIEWQACVPCEFFIEDTQAPFLSPKVAKSIEQTALCYFDVCKSVAHMKKLLNKVRNTRTNFILWSNQGRIDTNDTLPFYRALEKGKHKCKKLSNGSGLFGISIHCYNENTQGNESFGKGRLAEESKKLLFVISPMREVTESFPPFEITASANDDVIMLKAQLFSMMKNPSIKHHSELVLYYDAKVLEDGRRIDKCIPYEEISKGEVYLQYAYLNILGQSKKLDGKILGRLNSDLQEIKSKKSDISKFLSSCLTFLGDLRSCVSTVVQDHGNDAKPAMQNAGLDRIRKNLKNIPYKVGKAAASSRTAASTSSVLPGTFLVNNCLFSDDEIRCLRKLSIEQSYTKSVEDIMREYNIILKSISEEQKANKEQHKQNARKYLASNSSKASTNNPEDRTQKIEDDQSHHDGGNVTYVKSTQNPESSSDNSSSEVPTNVVQPPLEVRLNGSDEQSSEDSVESSYKSDGGTEKGTVLALESTSSNGSTDSKGDNQSSDQNDSDEISHTTTSGKSDAEQGSNFEQVMNAAEVSDSWDKDEDDYDYEYEDGDNDGDESSSQSDEKGSENTARNGRGNSHQTSSKNYESKTTSDSGDDNFVRSTGHVSTDSE